MPLLSFGRQPAAPPPRKSKPTELPALPAVKRAATPRKVDELVVAAAQPAEQRSGAERRVAPRIAAASFPAITGTRLSPCGGNILLVNISTSGAAVRSDARLILGTPVTVIFEGAFSPSSIKARVMRCEVTAIEAGVVWYHIGLAFNEPISLETAGEPPSTVVEEPAPVSEEAAPVSAAPVVLTNRW